MAGLPLTGVRVLDYSQYVAGPLATMLLADIGADVIKVEPPHGDAWRRYASHAPGESAYFYALNRGKRSVVLDLKTAEGRAASRRLIATADAVVHNLPPERAVRFGLDRETVRRVNPAAVHTSISAFGTGGPDSDRRAYDLIAQALSGLLLADAHPGDEVPRRSGGIPFADITAGLLACVSVVAGLYQRGTRTAPGIEVSLLGAALATQVQRFVRIESDAAPSRGAVDRPTFDAVARTIADAEELEPYYRCYETADGFLALGCLNAAQRRRVQEMLRIEDPWADDPQASPADAEERSRRAALVPCFAQEFRRRPTAEWVRLLGEHGVPAGEVRRLTDVFDDEQARANGLIQDVRQDVGQVQLLGNLFKIEGAATVSGRAAPALGQHTAEVFGELDGDREGR